MRTDELEYKLKIQKIVSKLKDEIIIKKEIKCVKRKRTTKETKKFRIRIRNSLEDRISNSKWYKNKIIN